MKCLIAKLDGAKLKSFVVFGGAKYEAVALHKEYRSRCIVTSVIGKFHSHLDF